MSPKTIVRIAALTSLLAFAAMAPPNTMPVSEVGTLGSSTENSPPSAKANAAATLDSSLTNASPVVGSSPTVALLLNSVHVSGADVAVAFYERALGFGQRFMHKMGQYAGMESGVSAAAPASNSSRHELFASAR